MWVDRAAGALRSGPPTTPVYPDGGFGMGVIGSVVALASAEDGPARAGTSSVVAGRSLVVAPCVHEDQRTKKSCASIGRRYRWPRLVVVYSEFYESALGQERAISTVRADAGADAHEVRSREMTGKS